MEPEGQDMGIDIEELAKACRDAWNGYAKKTLKKPPKSMVANWEETGDWGREANRVVARAALDNIRAQEERALASEA